MWPSTPEPWDVALHKPYLKVLYNSYAALLMDNLIDCNEKLVTHQNQFNQTNPGGKTAPPLPNFGPPTENVNS